jgi:hypothetical protein
MSETITYYAVTIDDDTHDNPAGLARRRQLDNGGIEDEMLRRDMTWQRDSLVAEWKRGDAVEELCEISEDEADALIERFREKWAE